MAAEIPYMMQMGNIASILDRIQEAGTPPKFTHEFLKGNLGFRGSGDRGIVKVLRQLKFLSDDGTPTSRYNEFRSKTVAGRAIADGLREGWAPVFLSDQRAQEKTVANLTETFKGITGAGDSVAQKMAATFKALASKADWTITPAASSPESQPATVAPDTVQTNGIRDSAPLQHALPLSFHHNIHLHLPATSDPTVYAAIFRALKAELSD
jgi:hypothetical protein